MEQERVRLAAAQARLVQALVGQGEPPAGFDSCRLELATRSLLNKRLRETARAWPAVARCLGERYPERFRDHARRTPPPAEGGALADGWVFVRGIPAGELDDEARREIFLTGLHWRRSRDGLRLRRGPALRAAWLPQQRRLALGVRLPWLGVWVFYLPLGSAA